MDFVERPLTIEPTVNYVLVGLRRAGKTYMLYQTIRHLLNEGHKKEGELQIAYEVENIVKMSALGQKKEQEVTTEEGTKTAGTKADTPKREEKNVAKQTEGKRKESYQKRDSFSYRRSDNPDVIYGKDFEEDAIAIETIVGEMGEVVIRGQILSLDTREIRNEKTIIILSLTDFTDTIILKIFTTQI